MGLISAHAEEAGPLAESTLMPVDDLRACGGDCLTDTHGVGRYGTSPRLRRRHVMHTWTWGSVRNISARAEETDAADTAGGCLTEDLRACGEDGVCVIVPGILSG